MNDDKKALPTPGGTPSPSSEAEGNPWDEDDDGGGRTLATDGPSFEMPSNIPSPITVPPPAIDPPKMPGTMPLIGFSAPGRAPGVAPARPLPAPLGGPPRQVSPATPTAGDLSTDALAAAAAAGAPAPPVKRPPPLAPRVGVPSSPRPGSSPAMGGLPPSARMPIAPVVPAPAPAPLAEEEGWANAGDPQDDGPTMAGASPAMSDLALRDDVVRPRPSPLASTGFAPEGAAQALAAARSRAASMDAETMAGKRPLPPPGMDAPEAEETTRAVSREELMRHQDASVIVGEDAIGDEATLALPPGSIDLSLGVGSDRVPSIGAALADILQQRDAPGQGQPQPQGPPAFPAPPHAFQNNAMSGPGGSSGHVPAAHPHGQYPGGGGAPQSQPQQSHWGAGAGAGFDPMLPQSGMGPAPMGSPMSAPYPSSGQQPVFAGATQQADQHPMHGMQPMPGQPAWNTQLSPPPAGTRGPSRFTPQVILLIAVGSVCLAIFIIGIVLFVTTKF